MMTEQEYLSKMDRRDEETKNKFEEVFGRIITEFQGLSYSKAELLLEHLKRMLKKDSVCKCQGWEKGKQPTV